MTSIFEQGGTVAVTNGSREVVGTGTTWLNAYDGVALNLNGLSYPVESINGTTSLTLVKPYPGVTGSGLEYTFVPVQPTNYQLSKKVQEVLDVAGELVDATVGPAGPPGPAGPIGPSGKNGDAGFGSIVNFADYKALPAGGSGVYMIVPVANGDPDGLTLTQSASVILPKDKPNAGIGMWIKSTVSGYAITLGLTNAPEPQPDVPGEDIDLSGSGTVYGDPGTIFPLGIFVANSNAAFTITLPKKGSTATPIKARYWGFIIDECQSEQRPALGDIKFFNKGGTQLTPVAVTAHAVPYQNDQTYRAANVIDGNPASFWLSDIENSTPRGVIWFDFGSAVAVDSATVWNRPDTYGLAESWKTFRVFRADSAPAEPLVSGSYTVTATFTDQVWTLASSKTFTSLNGGSSTATLPILIERRNATSQAVSSSWRLGGSGAPYPGTGDAVDAGIVMNKQGDPNAFEFRNGNVVVNNTGYLQTDPLALDFPMTSDDNTTQTPERIRLSFKGVVAAGTFSGVLGSLMDYGYGEFRLEPYWNGSTLKVTMGRNGGQENVISDDAPSRVLGTNQLYEAEWTNNSGGDGGTMRFFVDGVQIGQPKTTSTKPRITPAMRLEINASGGNTAVATNNLEIEQVGISFAKPSVALSYDPATDGAISRADLEALVVDARSEQAGGPYTLAYTADGTDTFTLDINIGEMVLPAGRAYKAVLEDWSTGVGIEHPNHLVMTKVAAQNCRFEDADLYGAQASWTEVLPKGPVPNINGINYYCEGVRIGTYVQFQFIYDWDAEQMPANPFGDPTNKESYMVPHKWKIYDSAGTLLARIEQPSGEPLNNADRPAVWEGQYDGRGVAIITADNRWVPHGTVRSSVIWRSHEPPAYSQSRVWETVPTFDARVPFACHAGYSVNGGDARLFSDGQANGFANYRAMSWEPSDSNDLMEQANASPSPYRALFTSTAVAPNAGIWLRYTPFNTMGRSPVTGPGGVRDDRQLMPDMVALYARDVNAKRLFDNRPLKNIALDYLTGYASDPFHGMENGRCTPVYKGNARRYITMRNHYYGPGQAATPPSQAWYVQGGRPYEWATGNNPLRVRVPYGGVDPKRPIFNTFQIDKAHSHQFPHWGSMLFQSPEFAFLGHKLSDQCRLYSNNILNDPGDPNLSSNRETAWAYIHAALMWKTASTNSSRLYNRAEVMDWVVFDFESFYDTHYASDPGFLNPPTNIFTNGSIDMHKAAYAAAARFGIVTCYGGYVYTHDFMVGYWLSALQAGEKLGFNQALRDASPKCKAVLDWLMASHRKRIVGRLNNLRINAQDGTEYLCPLWTVEQMNAAGGDVSQLPQNFQQVYNRQTVKAPSWDTYTYNGSTGSRDGQSMDQLLAGPGLLLSIFPDDAELTAAAETAEARFQEKLASESAKGAQAGTGWFLYHQVTNNRPYIPPV